MEVNYRQRSITFVFILLFSVVLCSSYAETKEEPREKILGFELNNFDENNNKTWDLAGETLEMIGEVTQLTQVNANVYGEEDTMNVVADTGTYDRDKGKVHLQDNVIMTSETGAKVVTDTLDWLQKEQLVTTEDKVNIYRDTMEAEGVGAVGKPDLKQMSLKKDVRVDIDPQDENDPLRKITITCDGPLDIDYLKGEAVFNNNVEAFDKDRQLFADQMTGFFDTETKEMVRVVCVGNVKIIRGENIAYSERAIYNAENQQISLIGRPKLVIYQQEDEEEKE